MRSRIPKVLHRSPAAPSSITSSTRWSAESTDPVVVTGHGADAVEARSASGHRLRRQEPQLGTGDAVRIGMQGIDAEAATIVVTMGDAPLQPPSLPRHRGACRGARGHRARLGPPDRCDGLRPRDRDAGGDATAIVEEADVDDAARGTDEINVGTYAFDAAWLRDAIARVGASASGRAT